MLEQPLLYRLTGACRVVLYPVGQTKTITLYLTRQQAEELADVLLPVTDLLWHAPARRKAGLYGAGCQRPVYPDFMVAGHPPDPELRPGCPDRCPCAAGTAGGVCRPLAAAGTAWLLVLAGTLFCISLVRSALQAVHYTVWRTDTQLGSRGGLVRRYEMRLRLCQLNYADLRRSPPHGHCITARYLSRQGRAARSCPCSSGGRALRCCGSCCPRWRSCPGHPRRHH